VCVAGRKRGCPERYQDDAALETRSVPPPSSRIGQLPGSPPKGPAGAGIACSTPSAESAHGVPRRRVQESRCLFSHRRTGLRGTDPFAVSQLPGPDIGRAFARWQGRQIERRASKRMGHRGRPLTQRPAGGEGAHVDAEGRARRGKSANAPSLARGASRRSSASRAALARLGRDPVLLRWRSNTPVSSNVSRAGGPPMQGRLLRPRAPACLGSGSDASARVDPTARGKA